MTSHTAVLKTKLASLSLSLSEFEDALEPLFLKSFPETLLALDDNPIQKAKLTTLIPYLVYDLIFSLFSFSAELTESVQSFSCSIPKIKGHRS